MKYDKDPSFYSNVETLNMLCHSCGRDCKFAPIIRHSKHKCFDWRILFRGNSGHPNLKGSGLRELSRLMKKDQFNQKTCDPSRALHLTQVDLLLKRQNMIGSIRKRVLK